MSKIYAVKYKDGTKTTFDSWPLCQENVKGVKGVKFKSFNTSWEAEKWLETSDTKFIDNNDIGIKIYVDGSYMDKIKTASWGFVVVENDTILYQNSGVITEYIESRNIVGECFAAMNGIKWAVDNNKNIQLIHDYAGISAWLTGEWSKDKPIAKMYYNNCFKYINRIKFVNIRGHQGNKWNEYVDKYVGDTLKNYYMENIK